ncbi:MAG: nitroreductase family protein [Deltaproteobacteria bacterium]|nr:nitroreductase family protein [Deltaproteobacteria bacterium]
MDFLKLVQSRYSVRAYKPDEVAPDKLERILEAVRLAPSAKNQQAFRFIVIYTQGREQELARIFHQSWLMQAPIIVAACGVPNDNWRRSDGKNYNDVDVTIAMDHLILAATAEGLGTCWIGAFKNDAAKEVLKLPDGVEPIAFTPLGYANDQSRPKLRKKLSQLISYEYW